MSAGSDPRRGQRCLSRFLSNEWAFPENGTLGTEWLLEAKEGLAKEDRFPLS